jgi:hypothetical protein
LADQEPVVAVIRTKNGHTMIGVVMELHYEHDPETKRLIEIDNSVEPDTTESDLMAFRKGAWKFASEIAQGLGRTA